MDWQKLMSGALSLGLLICIISTFAGCSHSSPGLNAQSAMDVPETDPEYQPKKQHLYSLYLEEMEDTVVVGQETAIVLKTVVVDTLHFKK